MELFDLARATGLEVKTWSRTSQRYLVSPLTGNGKIESVLSFVATRRLSEPRPRLAVGA